MNSMDIVIVTDYHSKAIQFRIVDASTGEERSFNRATSIEAIEVVLAEARKTALPRGGQVVWIMESTTGWVRVKKLLGGRATFLLANVLQVPLPPKAYRRKTDKLDTARLLREYLHGELPLAHQPDEAWRQARRVVALRENLVGRRTTLRNQVKAYFAHETWDQRTGFFSGSGIVKLRERLKSLPEDDAFVLQMKLDELDELAQRIEQVEEQLLRWYAQWPDARKLDAIKGIAEVSAVAIVARIGPIDRFANADQLVAFAGLAPGVRQSDEKSRNLSIGGGGTDKALRHYLIEATMWVRQIPRYEAAYERVAAKRGTKVARIAVARMLLRSIYKMLKDNVEFRAAA